MEDVDWDVFQEDAEIDYDEPEHLLNDTGIPFEPFNLKEERNSGYFDAASGSYIQLKKKKDVDDAWADALAATEVDAGWAQAVMDRVSAREVKARRKGGNGSGERGSNATFSRYLSIEEIVELKQNIVSLLQPGENVLAALRRLGRTRNSIPLFPRQVPGEAAVVEVVPINAAASKERDQVSQLTQVTSIAVDTMRGGADPQHHHHHQQQKQKPTSLIKRASLPPQSQLEFDQLTDWSSVLMESGEFLIHSQTREDLLNSLQGRQQHGAVRNADEEEEQEDIDMFAEEEVTPLENNGKQQEQQDTVLLSSHQQHQHQQAQQAQQEHPAPLGQPLPHEQPLEDESDHQPLLQGFVLQPDSGYYYNSSIGAYYDPQSRLFGDAGTGKWYKFNHKTGKYILS